jgi:hypothetical protein
MLQYGMGSLQGAESLVVSWLVVPTAGSPQNGG